MTLRQMEYAVAIADAGSVTAAAEALRVAQPSLSQQLRALERELGVELFVRTGRGLVPTAAGRGFLTEARSTLEASRRARTLAQACGGTVAGELLVAVERSHALVQLPGALRTLRRRFPGLRIEVLESEDCHALERAVRTGTADVAIGGIEETDGLDVRELGTEAFVVVLPEEDPLLQRDALDLAMLADRAWVRHQGGCVEDALFDGARRRSGVELDVVARTSQVDAAVRLAVAGLGATLVPESAVPREHRPLARPLEPGLSRRVAVAVRVPTGRAEEALIDALLAQSWTPDAPECSVALAAAADAREPVAAD